MNKKLVASLVIATMSPIILPVTTFAAYQNTYPTVENKTTLENVGGGDF